MASARALPALALALVIASAYATSMQPPLRLVFANTSCSSGMFEGAGFLGDHLLLSMRTQAVSAAGIYDQLVGSRARPCPEVPEGSPTAALFKLDSQTLVSDSFFVPDHEAVQVFTSPSQQRAVWPQGYVDEPDMPRRSGARFHVYSAGDLLDTPSNQFDVDFPGASISGGSFADDDHFAVYGYMRSNDTSGDDNGPQGAVLYVIDANTGNTIAHRYGGVHTVFAGSTPSADQPGFLHGTILACENPDTHLDVGGFSVPLNHENCTLIVLINVDPVTGLPMNVWHRPLSNDEAKMLVGEDNKNDNHNDGGSSGGSGMTGMGGSGMTGMTGMTGMDGESGGSGMTGMGGSGMTGMGGSGGGGDNGNGDGDDNISLYMASVPGVVAVIGRSRFFTVNTTLPAQVADVDLHVRRMDGMESTPGELQVMARAAAVIPGTPRVLLGVTMGGNAQMVLEPRGVNGLMHNYIGGGQLTGLLVEYDMRANSIVAVQALNADGMLSIDTVAISSSASQPRVFVTGTVMYHDDDWGTSTGQPAPRRRITNTIGWPPMARQDGSAEGSFFMLLEPTGATGTYSAMDAYDTYMYDYDQNRYVRSCTSPEQALELCRLARGPMGWTCTDAALAKQQCDAGEVPVNGGCLQPCTTAAR